MTAKALQMAAVALPAGGLAHVAAKGYRPMGVPYYWGDDQGGELKAAVIAFHMGHPSAAEVLAVADYLTYWIYAPCWALAARGNDRMTEGLEELKKRSLTLASEESVHRFIDEAMELGLDPF